MSVISWNYRGFASSSIVTELRKVCRKVKHVVVFLMETKVGSRRMERVSRRSFEFEKSVYVDPEGIGGGLVVWWRDVVDMSFLKISKNVIHAAMNASFLENGCYVSFVYGPPNHQNRDAFWRNMHELRPPEGVAWICVGDFNDILHHSEKQGGNYRPPSSFERFRGWMFECDMFDMGFKGCSFTWSNGQGVETFIRERIDRGVCNAVFRSLFPLALIIHNEMVHSDHCLLIMDLFHKVRRGQRRFRFDSFGVCHDEFPETVSRGWCKENIVLGMDPIAGVVKSLQNCEDVLRVWSR